jgi:hypothetical protein
MKTHLRFAFVAAVALGVASPAIAGDLKLTMQGGRVTVIARDVPVRQILQEWARVGTTNIVNGDKVPGPPITVELINVPEQQALDILLRSAAGYMAAPRPIGVAGASVYDRIMILPTSRPPAVTASATPPPAFQPRPQPMPVDDDDEQPVNMPMAAPMPAQGQQNPVIAPFPGVPPSQPMPANGQPVQPPPVMTSPVPGALPTPVSPNGMPPNPYPPNVVRPGGPGGPGVPPDREGEGRN